MKLKNAHGEDVDIKVIKMKDIKGYEGRYAITSCGKVWSYSLNRFFDFDKDWKSYVRVSLFKDGKSKHFQVHRLVAQAYIPNPDNLPCVNHKDENKLNNCVNNLEWCTVAYNNNYGTRNKKISIAKEKYKKRCICVETGEVFNSIKEAKKLKLNNKGALWACLNGINETCGGYHWKYYDEEVDPNYDLG